MDNKGPKPKKIKWTALLLAIMALVIIGYLLPPFQGLPVAGQRALGILAFAVLIWVTEAVTYPVSAAFIIALLTVLLGLSPSLAGGGGLIGTKTALEWALSGFSSSAAALVAGALFLSAAMQETGLDKRIALIVLSKVGSSVKGILFGVILVGIFLAFFIPSPTARVGAMIPIILGMVTAFGLPKTNRLSALLLLATAHTATIWSIGIKTATPQNMVGLNFIEKAFPYSVSWLQWFLAAAPWSVVMTIVLYFGLIVLVPQETKAISSGKNIIKKQLQQLGKMPFAQIRLLFIAFIALVLWATEGSLHPFDSTTIVIMLVSLLLAPGIGVLSWSKVEKLIPWGTIILFAAGISLGTVLLKTNGASWLAKIVFQTTDIRSLPIVVIVAILAAFAILLHLGFASATSLAATLIPVAIAFVEGMKDPGTIHGMGIVLITQFAIGFGFILPVNAPQNMLAYGTGTFETKDFIKTGLLLTILGYGLLILFSFTYWKWVNIL